MSLSGDRIRDCRIRHHLTQDDVAKYLGIGKQAVYKYEIGAVTNIPLENLEKMATLFNTTPEYLAGWTDDADEKKMRPGSYLVELIRCHLSNENLRGKFFKPFFHNTQIISRKVMMTNDPRF